MKSVDQRNFSCSGIEKRGESVYTGLSRKRTVWTVRYVCRDREKERRKGKLKIKSSHDNVMVYTTRSQISRIIKSDVKIQGLTFKRITSFETGIRR